MTVLSRKRFQMPSHYLADPVLWSFKVDPLPHRLDVKNLFHPEGKSMRLITFGRDEEKPDGPHYIAVRSGTPLHHDPAYPRYTCQMVLHCDGYTLGGWDESVRHDISAGTIFCLDAHSPHVLLDGDPRAGGIYLACSTDSHTPIEPADPAIIGPMAEYLSR